MSKANPEAPSRPSTCGLHLRMPASLPSPKDPSLIRLEFTKSPQFLFWKGHISSHILRLCRVRLQHTHRRGHSSVCSGYTPGKSEKQLSWVSVPKLPLHLPVPGTLTSPAIVASWVASLNSTVSESPGIAPRIAAIACPPFTGSRVLPLTVGVDVVPTVHCKSQNCLHLSHLSTPGL